MYFTENKKILPIRPFILFLIRKLFLFCCVFFTGCMWERPVKIKGIFTLPKILEQATGAAGTDSCSSKIP
ncbi:MAG TPA: hypothetical protein PK453_18055, partial [Leptospiraceae bacterium]|nr:hypothetical protein [Leptospiraceae bacterium]